MECEEVGQSKAQMLSASDGHLSCSCAGGFWEGARDRGHGRRAKTAFDIATAFCELNDFSVCTAARYWLHCCMEARIKFWLALCALNAELARTNHLMPRRFHTLDWLVADIVSNFWRFLNRPSGKRHDNEHIDTLINKIAVCQKNVELLFVFPHFFGGQVKMKSGN